MGNTIKHIRRCKTNVSCIDCQKEFTVKTVKLHVSCITEDQKYKGKFAKKRPREQSFQQKMQIEASKKAKKENEKNDEKDDKKEKKKNEKKGDKRENKKKPTINTNNKNSEEKENNLNEPLKKNGVENIPEGRERIPALQAVLLSELSNHSNGITMKKLLKNYFKRINGDNKENLSQVKDELWKVILKSKDMIKLRLN